MHPQFAPWGGCFAVFGATWARLLGQIKGTAGRPWPGFPTKHTSAFSPPSSFLAPLGVFLGDRVAGRE